MNKEEQKKLIAGRIIDEYHKHKSINWHEIAASKIHTQWFEYFDKETKQLREELEALKAKHKEDVINAYCESGKGFSKPMMNGSDDIGIKELAEQYYKQTHERE